MPHRILPTQRGTSEGPSSNPKTTLPQRLWAWTYTAPASQRNKQYQQRKAQLSLSEKTTTRNYEKMGAYNWVFCFGGRLRTTTTIYRRPYMLATLFLAVSPGVLFLVFLASWYWHRVLPAVVIVFTYLWVHTLVSFAKAATTDPGVLPRNVNVVDSVFTVPQEYSNAITLPVSQGPGGNPTTLSTTSRLSKGLSVTTKYCSTCRVWRPPRASHCVLCDACISDMDHHCIWLNNCVGLRNYTYFFSFILMALVTSVYLNAASYFFIFHRQNFLPSTSQRTTPLDAIRDTPVSVVLVVYSHILMVYALLLVTYHLYLNSAALKTREALNNPTRALDNPFFATRQCRKRLKTPLAGTTTSHVIERKNPFDSGSAWKNLVTGLCKPRGVSFVRARDEYVDDQRFDNLPPTKEPMV